MNLIKLNVITCIIVNKMIWLKNDLKNENQINKNNLFI